MLEIYYYCSMKQNPYVLLASYVLPQELSNYFEVVDVAEEKVDDELLLHIYLEELEAAPEGHADAVPNGFYEETRINDFPVRDHRTVLHIRRRRWKDAQGKSVSRDWQLVAKGTRHSKEFASFLKEYLGYVPDYGTITGSAISHKGR